MKTENSTAKLWPKKSMEEAGLPNEGNELIILTHKEAEAAIQKIIADTLKCVVNLENGTWKTPNETPGTRTALTVEQLAEELQLSRTTAYALVKQAGFPSFTVGKRIMVSRNGLQSWMDNGGTNHVEAC